MIINDIIRKMICEKLGCDLSRSAHFEALSEDIFCKTKERLGINTLKRLFGVIPEVGTTKTTLNIIAKYLGYHNWDLLNKTIEGNNSHFNDMNTIYPKKMTVGARLSISYSPDRTLLLEIVSEDYCKVITSSSGKLQPGDLLDIVSITPSTPFFVNDVIRDGQSIGNYIGGIEGGVSDIHIIGE
jgi:hypothetical protein